MTETARPVQVSDRSPGDDGPRRRSIICCCCCCQHQHKSDGLDILLRQRRGVAPYQALPADGLEMVAHGKRRPIQRRDSRMEGQAPICRRAGDDEGQLAGEPASELGAHDDRRAQAMSACSRPTWGSKVHHTSQGATPRFTRPPRCRPRPAGRPPPGTSWRRPERRPAEPGQHGTRVSNSTPRKALSRLTPPSSLVAIRARASRFSGVTRILVCMREVYAPRPAHAPADWVL